MFENDIKNDNDVDADCIQIRRGSNGDAQLHYAQCSEQNLVVCQKELNEMMRNLKMMVNNLNENFKNMVGKLRNIENQLQELKNKDSKDSLF
jgi:uncharacterized coiled-coil protein SlyX